MSPFLIRRIDLLLRAGIAACFIGHGAFGLLRKEAWRSYFTIFGMDPATADTLMPLIGSVDILVGVLVLAWPTRALLAYGVVWCAMTAVLRPLAGESLWELAERAGNYGVPLALLVWLGIRPGMANWFRRVRTTELGPQRAGLVLRVACWTTAALLVGHGILALARKPLLVEHLTAIGLTGNAVITLGILELGLATLCIARPGAALFGGIALWKLSTESLFIASGAPVWEFVERGGSYVAPAAAALMLLAKAPAAALAASQRPRAARAVRAGLVLVALAATTAAAPAAAQNRAAPDRGTSVAPAFNATAAAELRRGGYVLACRHGLTDRSAPVASPFRLDDPSTQRILSPAGERQMRAAGVLVAASGVPFTDIRTSPLQRTRRSAELMFGAATIDDALYSGGTRVGREELFHERVERGKNRVLMTHQGVLYPILSLRHGSIDEGDCIMVRPTGSGLEVVARIAPEHWAIYRVSR